MPRVRRAADAGPDHGPDFLEGLARGFRVIDAFNAASRPLTLSEVARLTTFPRATARRVLFTLEKLGFVASDGRLFSLTSRVLTLASAYLSSNQITTVMQPVMDRIATEVQEVCSAAILDSDNAVFVARASPARVFSTGLELGHRLPAFCTSVGRVLLGGLSEEALRDFMGRLQTVAATPQTIVDPAVLTALVITAREQGYALVDREAEQAFRSIAVPVRRYDGAVVAAMNIGAHVDRISAGRMIDVYRPLLNDAADEIRRLLM